VTANFLEAEDSYEDVLEVTAEEDLELAYILLLDSGYDDEEALELLFGERQPFMSNTTNPANESRFGSIDIPRHRFRGCIPTDPSMLLVPLKRQKP
jgi:hypothetical protein